jgi:hypothetical protein
MVQVLPSRSLGITGNPDYDGEPFTQFSSVTPETDVAGLNLNWREKDLPEWQRTKHVHRLHPYLGKFVPQLVEIFLRKYQPTVVCDPFCGSGTTLVEALGLGIHAVGADVSLFNCLLTQVKTARYDLALLQAEIDSILDELKAGPQLSMKSLLRESDNYLLNWYAPKAREELFQYRALIANYRYKDVLRIILSRAARSARLTTHFDLDFPRKPTLGPYACYKHRRTCSPTQEAMKFLTRYSLDTLRRIGEFSTIRQDAAVRVIEGDARDIQFPDCDLVITSPPYVGLIDYHEQHRYAYELLGLNQNRTSEIGASWKGNSRKAVTRYVEDMTESFANVARSLEIGGRLVVVVHDRRDLYEGIAQRLGLKVEYRLQRHVNRRTGRRAGDFFEDVIVWRT